MKNVVKKGALATGAVTVAMLAGTVGAGSASAASTPAGAMSGSWNLYPINYSTSMYQPGNAPVANTVVNYDISYSIANIQRVVNATKVWQTSGGWGYDCIYGQDTANHVKAWQRAHGLTADGIVGPQTAAKMGFHYIKRP